MNMSCRLREELLGETCLKTDNVVQIQMKRKRKMRKSVVLLLAIGVCSIFSGCAWAA